MKLVDLRKLAIKKRQRIRFPLNNGMECVMNELGVALVPGLDRVPDFNLEQELETASVFVLEPLDVGQKNAPRPADHRAGRNGRAGVRGACRRPAPRRARRRVAGTPGAPCASESAPSPCHNGE